MVYAHDVMPAAKQAIASGNERALVKLPTPKQITRRIKRELRIAVKAAGHG